MSSYVGERQLGTGLPFSRPSKTTMALTDARLHLLDRTCVLGSKYLSRTAEVRLVRLVDLAPDIYMLR